MPVLRTQRIPRGKVMPSKEVLSRRGRNSKNKGRGWEKEVAKLIAHYIELPLEDVYHARAGKKEEDIQLSAAARAKFPFHVECKNEKVARVPAWIRQMEDDIKTYKKAGKPVGLGIVVFKQHGDRTPYALIRFDLLLEALYVRKGRSSQGQ